MVEAWDSACKPRRDAHVSIATNRPVSALSMAAKVMARLLMLSVQIADAGVRQAELVPALSRHAFVEVDQPFDAGIGPAL